MCRTGSSAVETIARAEGLETAPDICSEEWRDAAADPKARAMKARRSRPRARLSAVPEPPQRESGDLFG